MMHSWPIANHLPRPRMGLATHALVRACMDVSDGLVQDLGHICRASGVSAELEAGLVPLSDAARRQDRLELCLTGGDDYELLMAVAPACEAALVEHAARLRVPVTRVGQFRTGPPAVTVRDRAGQPMALARTGWSHFG